MPHPVFGAGKRYLWLVSVRGEPKVFLEPVAAGLWLDCLNDYSFSIPLPIREEKGRVRKEVVFQDVFPRQVCCRGGINLRACAQQYAFS